MRVRRLVFFLSCVLGAALPAQRRVPIVGRAELEGGSPWPRATVVLQTFVHPYWPAAGVVDRLVVCSDEQGRFRIDGLEGRTYCAFAREVDDGSGFRASQVVDAVGPGAPCTLVAEPGFRAPKLRLTGLDAWRARGPLRVVLPAACAVDAALAAVPDDGVLALPPLPAGWVDIEVRTADDHRIVRRTLPTRITNDLELPPPSPCLVRALDGPGGAPIAGAEVWLVDGDHQETLGTTGVDGFAEVDLGCLRYGDGFGDLRGHVFLRATGRCPSSVHEVDLARRDAAGRDALRREGKAQAFGTLLAGGGRRGRVLLADGVPAANQPVLVRCPAPVQHMRGAETPWSLCVRTATGPAGELPDLVRDAPGEVQMFALGPSLSPGAQHAWATTVVPVLTAAGDRPVDFGDLVLQRAVAHRCEFTLPDSAPALGATVQLDLGARNRPVRLLADRRGACMLPMLPGCTIDGTVAGDAAFWLGELTGQQGAAGAVTVPVRLLPAHLVECRVVDGHDAALAATVTPMLQRFGPLPLQPRQPGQSCPGADPTRLTGWFVASMPTDAGGVVRLPLPPGTWLLRGAAGSRYAAVQCEVGDEPLAPIVIRVP